MIQLAFIEMTANRPSWTFIYFTSFQLKHSQNQIYKMESLKQYKNKWEPTSNNC